MRFGATEDGLDERFNKFVVRTMGWTMGIGLAVVVILSILRMGWEEGSAMIFFGPLIGLTLGTATALVIYAIWIKPSAFIFGRIFRFLRPKRSETTAAMVAGTVTALIASIVFFVLAVVIPGDFDSIFAVFALFAPLSILAAPFVAWQLYRHRALAETK